MLRIVVPCVFRSFQFRTLTSKKKELHIICLDGVHMFEFRRQFNSRQATSSVVVNLVAHKFLDAFVKPYTPKQI
ncbi:unnamed protein product [Cuscuta epithymum]|uniref:Uncharacterized protein n=1 Tax=Cuscuta epithymum TaxID=186058 RepID=A0AAV0GKH8_9ASTE|nr:unnamed protein product [Cuscuta epithymum]